MRVKNFIYIISALAALSCSPKSRQTTEKFVDFKSAYQHLVDQVPAMVDWCRLENIVKEKVIFVNCKKKIIYWVDSLGKQDSVHFNKGQLGVIKIAQSDSQKWEEFLNDSFGLKENNLSANELSDSLGANLSDRFADNAALTWQDRALSVVYNACIGNVNRDHVLACRNKKLLFLSNTPLSENQYTFIDTTKFIKLINNNINKLSRLSDKDILDTLNKAVVRIERDFDFVYLNYRDDRIFVGDQECRFNQLPSVKESLMSHPEKIYVHKKGESKQEVIVELKAALPALSQFPLCKINDIPQPTAVENGGNKEAERGLIYFLLNWIKANAVYLLAGLLALIAIGLLIYILYGFVKKRKITMNLTKINQLSNKLIEIYLLDEKDRNDAEIEQLVKELRALCGDEFDDNFYYANDIIIWQWAFNKKYRKTKNRKKRNDGGGLWGELTLNEHSSIPEILNAFDNAFQTSRAKQYESEKQTLKELETQTAEDKVLYSLKEEYDTIIGSKTESELIGALDRVRKKHPSLPSIDTVAQLIRESEKEEKPSKQIYSILSHIDKVAGSTLYKSQESYILRACKYNQCSKMVDGVDLEKGVDLYTVLDRALGKFLQQGQTIEAAVDFLQLFKPYCKNKGVELKDPTEVLKLHRALTDAATAYKEAVRPLSSVEKELDFWQRMAFILISLSKCVLPVLNAVDIDNKLKDGRVQFLEKVKNDLLFTYVARYFYYNAEKKETEDEIEFGEKFLASLNSRLDKYAAGYNGYIGNDDELYINDTLKANEDMRSVMGELAREISIFRKQKPFIDKMWDCFVKDFLEQSSQTNRQESYFMEQLLNIAYMTVDFLDHVKGERALLFCRNYLFLLNNFDTEKTGCKDFVAHDAIHSTRYSNFIYDFARKNGAEHLKVLIDGYLIIP